MPDTGSLTDRELRALLGVCSAVQALVMVGRIGPDEVGVLRRKLTDRFPGRAAATDDEAVISALDHLNGQLRAAMGE